MDFVRSEGLIAATFTPFYPNGELNLSIIPQYAAKNFRIIIHVGSTSTKISKELTAHANSIGANAIGCMGPCCFQPKDTQSLVEFCQEVALSAPNLPFYYYHIPNTSGVYVKMEDFLIMANKVIPNLAGLKFTSMDLMEMLSCATLENKKFDIIHGHDETLLAGLVLGIKAAIGTTYNFMAPVFNELIKKFQQKNLNEALEIQTYVNQIIKIMLSTGSPISGGKAMMKLSGIDCGPCRLPLKNLSDEQIAQLKEKLEGIGYFDMPWK